MSTGGDARRLARSTIACDECRKRKKRCNAMQPRCSSCVAKGLDCQYYSQLDKRRPVAKDLVDSLEMRIKILEDINRQQANAIAQLRQSQLSDIDSSGFGSASTNFPLDNDLSEAIPISSPNASVGVTANGSNDLGLEKIVFKLKLGEYGEPEYRGPTSTTVHSRRHGLQGSKGADASIIPLQSPLSSPDEYEVMPSNGLFDGVAIALPGTMGLYPEPHIKDCVPEFRSLSSADFEHLLDLYFEWQNSCIVLLSQDWLHKKLENAYMLLSGLDGYQKTSLHVLCEEVVHLLNNDFSSSRQVAVANECEMLLLAIMSLAIRFSDWTQFKDTEIGAGGAGNNFFDSSIRILFRVCLNKPSLVVVQTATILACRAYGCGQGNSAWILHGISATTGIVIGLHVGKSHAALVSQGQMSVLDAQARVTTYWASIIVDRMLATCLGRHCLIHPHDFNTPLIPITNLSEHPEQNSFGSTSKSVIIDSSAYQNSIQNVCRFMVDLWKMNDEFLSEIYNYKNDMRNLPQYPESLAMDFLRFSETVARFRTELFDWYRALPGDVRLAQSHPLPHVLMLQTSFHNLIILMHRPFILEAAEDLDLMPYQQREDSTPQQYLSRIAIRACTSSAISITRTLDLFRKHYTLRRTIFVVVHFVLNACTVHIQNTFSKGGNVRKRAQQDLKICKSFLDELSTAWPAAREALNDVREIEQNAQNNDASKMHRNWSIFPLDSENFFFSPDTIGVWPEPMEFLCSEMIGNEMVGSLHGDSVSQGDGVNLYNDLSQAQGPDLQGDSGGPLFQFF